MRTFIYALKDENDQIRYIGKSNEPIGRLRQHIYESKKSKKNTHKVNWIKSMIANGLRPTVEIIDEVLVREWEEWEMFWIEYYKNLGFRLTNSTKGGEGLKNPSEEVINRMRISQLGKKASSESKKKMSESSKISKNSGRFLKNNQPHNKGVKGIYKDSQETILKKKLKMCESWARMSEDNRLERINKIVKNRRKNNPRINNCKCNNCGKEFHRKPSLIKSENVYCSNGCFVDNKLKNK